MAVAPFAFAHNMTPLAVFVAGAVKEDRVVVVPATVRLGETVKEDRVVVVAPTVRHGETLNEDRVVAAGTRLGRLLRGELGGATRLGRFPGGKLAAVTAVVVVATRLGRLPRGELAVVAVLSLVVVLTRGKLGGAVSPVSAAGGHFFDKRPRESDRESRSDAPLSLEAVGFSGIATELRPRDLVVEARKRS
jgi:hypothetical protein